MSDLKSSKVKSRTKSRFRIKQVQGTCIENSFRQKKFPKIHDSFCNYFYK